MIKHRALPRRLPRALPCSEDYFFSGATSWGSSAGRAGTPSSQDLERLKLSATVNSPPGGLGGFWAAAKRIKGLEASFQGVLMCFSQSTQRWGKDGAEGMGSWLAMGDATAHLLPSSAWLFFGEGLGKSSLGVGFPQLPKPSRDDPSGEMDLGPSGSTNPPPRGTMSIAG